MLSEHYGWSRHSQYMKSHATARRPGKYCLLDHALQCQSTNLLPAPDKIAMPAGEGGVLGDEYAIGLLVTAIDDTPIPQTLFPRQLWDLVFDQVELRWCIPCRCILRQA
jgi:hypothetical protein